MPQKLIFASTEQAFEYLADLTGSRVIVAKSMEDMMPELKDRF